MTVSAAGFQTQVVENIRLSVADARKLPITVGMVTEQVTVVGEATALQTASATLGGIVSSHQVSDLSLNGRALTQLLSTVPGVSVLGVQPSMNGTGMRRLFETGARLLLDGTDSGQFDTDLPDGGYGTAATSGLPKPGPTNFRLSCREAFWWTWRHTSRLTPCQATTR